MKDSGAGKRWALLWKKYRLAVLILLSGVLLMLLPTGAEKKAEGGETPAAESFSIEETEAKMEQVLGRIAGAGRLELMLTLKSGSQLQLAQDTEQSLGERESERRSEVVTIGRSGAEDVVVTRRLYPVYQGAVVVCQGADSGAVRLALTEAVCALTGLSSDRVTIVKWDE